MRDALYKVYIYKMFHNNAYLNVRVQIERDKLKRKVLCHFPTLYDKIAIINKIILINIFVTNVTYMYVWRADSVFGVRRHTYHTRDSDK